MRKLQRTDSSSKKRLWCSLTLPEHTVIHCIFLPLKTMTCHFGSVDSKNDWLLFCFSAQAATLTWFCTWVSLFSASSSQRTSVNAQEQTSSTRLQLQVLLFTLISMERLTEAHRKVKWTWSVVSVTHVIVAFLSVSVLEDNLQYSQPTSCYKWKWFSFFHNLCTLMLDTLTQFHTAHWQSQRLRLEEIHSKSHRVKEKKNASKLKLHSKLYSGVCKCT